VDRGIVLAVYGILSGWLLVIASLAFIKLLMITLGTNGLVVAIAEVALGMLTLVSFLYAWYWMLRAVFLRVKTG